MMKKKLGLLVFLLFVLGFSTQNAYAISYTVFEACVELGDTADSGTYKYRILAQTFTPNATHELYYVRLLFGRVGNPGVTFVSIAEVEDGIPSNTLISELFDTGKVPLAQAFWGLITFSSAIKVYENITYAIVLSAPDGNDTSDDVLYWVTDETASYDGGSYFESGDNGDSWSEDLDLDFLFVEGGIVYTPPILDAFPSFFLAVQIGLIIMIVGYGFSKVGEAIGDHAIGGFLIGGLIGAVITAQAGMLPVWFLTAVLICGGIGFYFWFRGG